MPWHPDHARAPASHGAKGEARVRHGSGSIGIGLTLAVGAAVACPDRKVVCTTSDGSTVRVSTANMYTRQQLRCTVDVQMYCIQSLWTMAREVQHCVKQHTAAWRSGGGLTRRAARAEPEHLRRGDRQRRVRHPPGRDDAHGQRTDGSRGRGRVRPQATGVFGGA